MGKPIEGLSRRELLELGAAGAALALITGAAACDSDETNEPPSAGERSPPARLTGRVVRPRDPGYPRARADWDKLFTAYPLAIVFARSVRDVVNALTWSQQNGVAVRVRSGRHHLAGWSNLDGGLVIDVSELKAVRIDSAARTATVGAGLTQGEIVEALGKRGRAVPVGSEGTVGLAGATLGGGFGFLTRSLGMSCDSLIGADVVVASGSDGAKTIRADEKRNPDLLWALRGAGNGNFGIVTSFTYRLHPLRKATFLSAKWNGLRDLPVVFDAWQRQAPGADRRLTSVVEVGGDAIQLFALLSEGSPAEARRLLAPVLRHGKPEVMAEASTWPKVFAGLQSPAQDGQLAVRLPVRHRPFSREGDRAGRQVHGRLSRSPEQLFLLELRRRGRGRPARRFGLPSPRRPLLRRAQRRLERSLDHPTGRNVDCRVQPGAAAVRQRRVRQRADTGHGGLGDRVLGQELPAAPGRQGQVRPGQRLPVRAEHRAGLNRQPALSPDCLALPRGIC